MFKPVLQSLRWYIKNSGYDKFTYFEKLRSLSHAKVMLPNDKLAHFQIPVPVDTENIVSFKQLCPDNSTLINDVKAKLADANDLRLKAYTDNEGNIVKRVMYYAVAGFQVLSVPVNLGTKPSVFELVVSNSAGTTTTYLSDLVELFTPATYSPPLSESDDLDETINL